MLACFGKAPPITSDAKAPMKNPSNTFSNVRYSVSHDAPIYKSAYCRSVVVPSEDLEASSAYNVGGPWRGTTKQVVRRQSPYGTTESITVVKSGSFRKGTDLASGKMVERDKSGDVIREMTGSFVNGLLEGNGSISENGRRQIGCFAKGVLSDELIVH